ncbi:Do family serine endopeptidase [Hephaestia sp. GCM10023244]|uniref:Do family serine endopeptidase n=1 Tax=unclassified Hephaestia TaxID=2631281 RepID=UPI0020779B0A|nr:Do family serine endopeptidase [Hephaestia sp. MAHUQ-44]
MRYAFAITGALLLGGAAATMTLEQPLGAQQAQNEPGTINAVAPKQGAPMSFADMVAKLQPAVVNISTTQHIKIQQQNPFAGTPFEDFFQQFGGGGGSGPITREGESLGSGFLISPDGYVVTNNHVIAPGAQGASVDTITVTLTDRKEYKARVVGRDAKSDLAVLKIDATDLPYVKFGDSGNARVGDWVVAIGNPFGIGSSVTAGIISAVHRTTGLGGADHFIQTDASINRGNSGGPMFDMQGNVIGVNSQILSPTGGNVGIGFAIPAEEARPIVDTLMKGGKIERGYLGVGIQPVTEDIAAALGLQKNRGEIVARVEPDGPAAKAGIKQGDVVVRVNGQEVTPDQSLSYLVANLTPGTRVPIELIRDGKRSTVTATMAMRPSEEELAGFNPDADADTPDQGDSSSDQSVNDAIGLTTTVLTPTIARQVGVDASTTGLVVTAVDPSSNAAQKLRRGDVIVSANGAQVSSPKDLANIVAAAKRDNRDQVLLFVQRGRGGSGFIPVKLKK